MQFLLTEEEFRALGPKKDIEKWQASAQALAVMVADHVPRSDGKMIGCIITNKGGYCDGCPAERGCPNKHKEFSQ